MKIVPILCGGTMHEAIAFNHPIEKVPQLEESINGLQRVLGEYKNACMIASVDFSHVGLRYGDLSEPNAKKLSTVEQIDRNLLAVMEQVDHKEFVAQLQQNHNITQICGVVPIYTMLRLLDGTRGSLLHYDRTESGPGSIVTFASMAWKTQD
jgi:AmmeMemoRadiSam system protein B